MQPDPFELWLERRKAKGATVTLIDLYRMAAEPRGLAPHDLPLDERTTLRERAMPVMWPGYQVAPGSERGPEPIEIVPYDPAWAAQFWRWHDRLARALAGTAKRVEHVGSTSVPGLAAKPVIDILVTVIDLEAEKAYVPTIEDLQLQLRSRDDLHRFFRPVSGLPRDVQVHVAPTGSDWERRHLLFRDYLRASEDARDAYLRAKIEAARLWNDDRLAYADAKTEVITRLMREAESWAARQRWTP